MFKIKALYNEAENPKTHVSIFQPNIIVFVLLKQIHYLNLIHVIFLFSFNL